MYAMKTATSPSLNVLRLKTYIAKIAAKNEGRKYRDIGEKKFIVTASKKPKNPAFMHLLNTISSLALFVLTADLGEIAGGDIGCEGWGCRVRSAPQIGQNEASSSTGLPQLGQLGIINPKLFVIQ